MRKLVEIDGYDGIEIRYYYDGENGGIEVWEGLDLIGEMPGEEIPDEDDPDYDFLMERLIERITDFIEEQEF
jgi:hypothetical protein